MRYGFVQIATSGMLNDTGINLDAYWEHRVDEMLEQDGGRRTSPVVIAERVPIWATPTSEGRFASDTDWTRTPQDSEPDLYEIHGWCEAEPMTTMCWLCMEPIEPGTPRIHGGHPDAGRDESGWNIAHQSHPECFEVYRDPHAGVVRFPKTTPTA